ncbi:hypothetical protein GTY60_20715 [Streptomyces sp. SID8367]|nr:hypothetical protein [Streptomyces sp. SID8367]
MLRLTAVAAVVVLALTGFSRGHGRHHSSSSGGGGCSSSSQDHDSSSSSTSGGTSGSSHYDDDDDDSYGSGGSTWRPRHRSTPSPTGSGISVREGTARLITCATATARYATVEVTNPNGKAVRFDVHVAFVDSSGGTVNALFHEVKVPANGKVTTKVPVGGDRPDAVVDHCEVDPEALLHT